MTARSFRRFALATATTLGALASAQAADVVAPAPSFSGLYAGVELGYGFGEVDSVRSDGAATATTGLQDGGDLEGFIGGVRVGGNVQTGRFVFGAELSAAIADMDYEGVVVTPPPPPPAPATTEIIGVNLELDTLVTLTGRVGVALGSRSMVFAKGGLAYGHTETVITRTATATEPPLVLGSDDNDRFGYTIGAGVESFVTDRVSLFAEYAYTDLGTAEYVGNGTTPPAPAPTVVRIEQDVQFSDVRVGLNFHF